MHSSRGNRNPDFASSTKSRNAIDEQKPTVLMPKIERNAKMNSEVETVKVKEPYLPGFAKGFLTSKSAVSSNNSVESQQEKKANKSNT